MTGNIGRNHSKTKEIILKSPLILDPVYKNLKKSYKNENVPLNTKTFTSWAGNLDVNFEKGSDILFVKYKNTNKKLILDSLNLISKEYQKYSNRDSKKQIENSILYLQEQQQILKREADFAQKRLNKFNIENGLGDLDGFVSLGKNNKFSYRKAFNDNKSEINPISQNINGKSAGLRFQNQFALLEEYETEYIVKSSYYKPNAKTLKALKLKIENLRESLKRPNEILIKYKDLTKEVARLDNFLFEIENKLQSLKLRRAKNNEPWEIISTPILDESKLAPNSKSVILSSLFFGLIGGCILAIIKEKLSNKVYEIKKSNVLTQCINTLYLNNENLNFDIVNKLFSDNRRIANEKNGLIFLKSRINENNNFENIFDDFKNSDLEIIDFSNKDKLLEIQNIILILIPGSLRKNELILYSKFISVYREKILGFMEFSQNDLKQ